MMRVQKWFGTVDDFVDPLIRKLLPADGKTVEQQHESLNGRMLGWLDMSYGAENIEKFIKLCDRDGFDNIIKDIYMKQIKTLGRFENYLNSKLG